MKSIRMKPAFTLLIIALCCAKLTHPASAQDSREAEIRRLENLEREAVLKSDSAVLFDKLWSPMMVINTPANVVGIVEGTKAHLRSGKILTIFHLKGILKRSLSTTTLPLSWEGKSLNLKETTLRRQNG